jgi:NitT/TauT family transport system substrate-binding protein
MTPVRLAAACAALVLVLAGCGGGDDNDAVGAPAGNDTAAETVSVQVACAQGFEHVPRHLAETQGINDDLGVEVECVQVATGPEMSAALLSGNLDVAIGNAANIAPLLDKDQDLVAFGMLRQRTYWDLLVAKDYDLPEGDWQSVVKALEGSRFGVVARGAAAETIARAMFREAGADPEKVTYIATGLPATTIAALAGGTIDAALTFEPGVSLALEQGVATNPFSLHAGEGPEALDHPDMMLFTTRELAEQEPEKLCRFRQSLDAGLEFMKDPANRDVVVAEAAELLQMPEPLAAKVLDRNAQAVPDSTELDREGIDKAFKLLKEGGSAAQLHTADTVAVDVC